ncbi:MAG: exonuclease SbcCD subunit D [Veillonella sp.]|uniref:exonuclease SbcCD subunit D n=1 Tax=Veillonella sp. TaxID=1926307 RepID=UPI0025E41172|nr:exonuclease SbcCD subunit D [Veillonella sp.]MBS4914343.1 exonuclease SbcCD subunit D [Veillonella sp.]
MRILHTADWHLGRIFYARHLTEDQAYVLEHQFLKLLTEAKIDVVVIAGDIFDRAVPPVEAVELWDTVLTKVAKELKIPVLVIGGNHDSAERLEVGKELFAPMGFHVWGRMDRALTPLELADEHGSVWFCPFPFTEPRSVRNTLESVQANLGKTLIEETVATDYGYTYLAWSQYIQSLIPEGQRSVAMAHAMVAGSETSPSERPLVIGGSANVGMDVFSPFNYTALGHIHRPQQMGRPETRYSGSLLKYSFDEANYNKSFTIIDMDGDGNCQIETVPITPPHDVVVLDGEFNDLITNVDLQTKHKEDYVLFRLLDKSPVIDGMPRLRAAYPMAMSLELAGRMEQSADAVQDVSYKNLSESELFEQFTAAVRDEPLTEEEKTYINRLWNRILKEEQ